jgi:hypothetical protein
MENYNRVKRSKYEIRYYLNKKLHRLDGPAYERTDGTKEWWQNGKKHRLDGHAYEEPGGYKEWYYEGKHILCDSQEEFERIIKLKLFL